METPADVYNIFLAAFYCTNSAHYKTDILSTRNPELDGEMESRMRFQYLDTFLLQGLYNSLQPDEVMLLLQWTLQAGCVYNFSSMSAKFPPALRPPAWQLVDLLEENKAQINWMSGYALETLLAAQHLSAVELLSALERFADHIIMVEILTSLTAAAALPSAEALGALRSALKMGDTEHVRSICKLPAVQGLAAAEMAPILASAAAIDNSAAVFTILRLPAAQNLSAADVAAALMCAASAGAGDIFARICSLPAAQQLSVSQLAAVMQSAILGGNEYMISCLCSLPAAQQLPPLEVAAALQLVIENSYTWITTELCQLPGAKQMGASQVGGLLEAARDAAAAAPLGSRGPPWLTEAARTLARIKCLPAARKLCHETLSDFTCTPLTSTGGVCSPWALDTSAGLLGLLPHSPEPAHKSDACPWS